LETLEDVTQRVSALQKQIDHRPDDYGVRLVLARAMVEAESVDQALIQYEELVTAERELPYVLGDLERVLQTQPENTWARRLVGDVHLRQGELGQALAAYRLALEQL
jgi:cytochrome c-type biogenesis protein CcmH/NrfG